LPNTFTPVLAGDAGLAAMDGEQADGSITIAPFGITVLTVRSG